MAFVNFLDDTSLMRDIIDRRPDRLADFLKLAHDVLRGTSDLSVGERELIGAFVSGLNNCTYCYGAHSATAARFGIDTGLFETLMDDIDGAAIDQTLKPLLHFIKKLTENPSRMGPGGCRRRVCGRLGTIRPCPTRFSCARFSTWRIESSTDTASIAQLPTVSLKR